MRTDKFIGITHKFNGNDYDGCDCIGLVRLFYSENNWGDNFWDNGEVLTLETYHSLESWKRLLKYLRKRFKETKSIDKLDYGAVVMFNINGDLHLGVYIGNGDLLTMQIPAIEGKSKSTIYRKKIWRLAFKRGFNR